MSPPAMAAALPEPGVIEAEFARLGTEQVLRKTWELTSPWTTTEIKVPVKFIVGDLDLTYHSPGIQDFIHKGGFKKFVPLLDDVVVMKDVGHFIND
ncbi:hypothetical protein EJB05_34597, partial [Eragrostis curvula]